jgi:hypothetical protein
LYIKTTKKASRQSKENLLADFKDQGAVCGVV